MKEGATYIITLQYEEIEELDTWERRPFARITQDEFTWTVDELFAFVNARIAVWESEWRIVDILSITLDLIH